MEAITIEVSWDGACIVREEKLKNARLCWYAPGLHIYVQGAMPVSIYARVCNIACNECIARHIPAISLKRFVSTNPSKTNFEDDDYGSKLI